MFLRRGLGRAVAATTVMAAVSTLADLIWALWIPQHLMVYGLLHGMLLCAVLGVVLGLAAGGVSTMWRGARGALLIGFLSAGTFYVFAPWFGWRAMLPGWIVLWLLMALLYERLCQTSSSALTAGRATAGVRATASFAGSARGVVGAVVSAAAFWAIAGIWTNPSSGAPNYPVNLASWFIAFLPGFAALMVGRPAGRY